MPRPRPIKLAVADLNEETLVLTINEGPLMFSCKMRYEDAEGLRDQLDQVLVRRKTK